MSRKYIKVEQLAAVVFEKKEAGESNRQNRKRRKLEAGVVVRPKGHPPKAPQMPEAAREQEIRQLKMTVELLRNFLSEAGRR